ncbi:DUF3106 domain-containing protein [Massilia sp.]|uniref:DUF3106 domain-containing protein n=1 Tax=Massilia sp. TaxID=1882437 RepID=UPI0028A1B3F6|nr:DUF3106 domain-containing protein [Massilia sp.]
MTKKTVSKSRFPVLRTVAGVLAAGAIAWVIVERFDTPAVLPTVADAASNARALPKTLDKPLWRDLSSSQQVALAPLEPQWDRMEGLRKRKWIEMSAKFASMPPSEQQRVHERMRQWMRLTPEQRERARENFSKTNRLAGDKSADWENYKQLSADEKRNLARAAAARKPAPVALPPEAPAIITPMPCPPNTTRRGAECIVIGAPEAAPAPAATAATPPAAGAPATAPAPAPAAPAAAPSPAAQAANASN